MLKNTAFIFFLFLACFYVYNILTNFQYKLVDLSYHEGRNSLLLSFYILIVAIVYEYLFNKIKYNFWRITSFIILFIAAYFTNAIHISYTYFLVSILETYSSFQDYLEWEVVGDIKSVSYQVFILTHILYGCYYFIKYIIKKSKQNYDNDLIDDKL